MTALGKMSQAAACPKTVLAVYDTEKPCAASWVPRNVARQGRPARLIILRSVVQIYSPVPRIMMLKRKGDVMNWLYLILGLPCGILMFLIGEKLAKKTKNSYLQGIALATPFAVFCVLVIIVDTLF